MYYRQIFIILAIVYYVIGQDTVTEQVTVPDVVSANSSVNISTKSNASPPTSQNFSYETLKNWKSNFIQNSSMHPTTSAFLKKDWKKIAEVSTSSPGNYVQCTPKLGSEKIEIVNATRLMKLLISDVNLKKDAAADCVLVYFYSPACPFSCAASRHFNALARLFPDIKMAAIDAMSHHIFNAQNGITGVPNLLFFHNGRTAARYNESEFTIQHFTKFIGYATGLTPSQTVTVTSEDFRGPLPITPEIQTDYCLGLSWSFIGICLVYFFSKSKYWLWVVETVQNTWRESAAQHEHNE